jgi:hypothetical protein
LANHDDKAAQHRTLSKALQKTIQGKHTAGEPFSDLNESAVRFAASALDAYLRNRWDHFLLDAGVSLEHLAKRYLASIHPCLVVEGREFDNLLYACGRPELAKPSHALSP